MINLHKQRFSELHEQMEDLLKSKSQKYDSYSNRSSMEIDGNALLEWSIKVKNLLNKACGQDSEHYLAFKSNEERLSFSSNLATLERLQAIYIAAREDYEGGYIQSIKSLVQAEVFDSELEQAKELLKNKYTTAAAVIAGAVLETTLRELCARLGIEHGKLDKMNADLSKAGTYNMLQQKRITALAAIRNSAAHGKAEEFSEQDALSMISEVEQFIAKHV